MKLIMFIMLSMVSITVYADCEDPLGIGGNEVLGNAGSENDNLYNQRNEKMRNGNDYGLNGCGDDPVDLPPMVVTGYYNAGPGYFWVGGGSWFYYLHPNAGGGTSSSNVSDSKLEFCFAEGLFEAISGYWPILGTAGTLQDLLNLTEQVEGLLVQAALHDIKTYFASDGNMHSSIYTSQHFVDWAALSISWENYGDTSSLMGNQTINDADVFPFFKAFMQDMGVGDFELEDIMTDPQPNVDC